MNVRRYVAPTAREALAQVRAELGADAVVLRNRPTPEGVEILAMPDAADPGQVPPAAGTEPAAATMSTVNFEAYVRDRQARRQQTVPPEAAAPAPVTPAPAAAPPDLPAVRQPAAPGGADAADAAALMSELRAMRGFLSEQIESMNWFEDVRRRPAQSRMLRLLLQAGFSASLSRRLIGHLPADFDDAEAQDWLRGELRGALRAAAPEQSVFDAGGVFALLGPTGVGKTTTAAKIAAQFALKHGAGSVGLITADVYRIGAQDQLRTFGRLLGVPVHVAHDVAGLADFLQLFMNRKLVLIDTAGVGQRDPRVGELLSALSTTEVRKVLVINAAMQAEAIDEVADAYQVQQAAGVVLSKVDEAVQLGGALDCLIRRRVELQGVANGQRVPEDWHRPDADALVERALECARSPQPTPFSFDEAELAMLMAVRPPQMRGMNRFVETHDV